MSFLNKIQSFTTAIQTGSFTAAAKKLNLSKSYVSKQVSQLEQELDTRLLYRTTRKLSLTQEGDRFYQHCKLIMLETQKAKAEVMNSHKNPSGNIKLTIPQSFVLSKMSLILTQFQKKYPEITLQISTSGNNVDLIEESIDLALRIGELEDSTLMCRKLVSCEFQAVASPQYIKKYGNPSTPQDLTKHNCLIYSDSQLNTQWPFKLENSKTVMVNIKGNLICDDGGYILTTSLNGGGICFGPSIMFDKYLTENKLCVLLPNYALSTTSISAIYPLNKNLSTRVKLLIDFLAAKL